MSGEWQCPGCDYETEAHCDNEHVYDCLVKHTERVWDLETENELLRKYLNERGDYQCQGCEGWFKSQKLVWKGVNGYRCKNCKK